MIVVKANVYCKRIKRSSIVIILIPDTVNDSQVDLLYMSLQQQHTEWNEQLEVFLHLVHNITRSGLPREVISPLRIL